MIVEVKNVSLIDARKKKKRIRKISKINNLRVNDLFLYDSFTLEYYFFSSKRFK